MLPPLCLCRYSEELSRCQEEVRRLQSALTSARQESTAISEERLTLQQENQQLQRDMEALRKECALAQRRAKQQVTKNCILINSHTKLLFALEGIVHPKNVNNLLTFTSIETYITVFLMWNKIYLFVCLFVLFHSHYSGFPIDFGPNYFYCMGKREILQNI